MPVDRQQEEDRDRILVGLHYGDIINVQAARLVQWHPHEIIMHPLRSLDEENDSPNKKVSLQNIMKDLPALKYLFLVLDSDFPLPPKLANVIFRIHVQVLDPILVLLNACGNLVKWNSKKNNVLCWTIK